VNDNKILLLLLDSLFLVDQLKADELIIWELLKNFELSTAFLLKLNIYNEDTNQILYFKALKVKSYFCI
jgi:hypothetical protein